MDESRRNSLQEDSIERQDLENASLKTLLKKATMLDKREVSKKLLKPSESVDRQSSLEDR